MLSELRSSIDWMESRINGVRPPEKVGSVLKMTGIVIEAEGPEVAIGTVCEVLSPNSGKKTLTQVVGFRDNHVLLMPLSGGGEIHPGCQVIAKGEGSSIPVGEALMGRVLDGLANPIDGKGPLRVETREGIDRNPPNPMERIPIEQSFETGIKSIDTFTSLGRGQRIGIFSGSGVGKSVLMGMIARGSEADVNVIALIGERGRELREFIQNDLGPEGLARSIVVVATSDQPPPMRIRAALMATAIAENFRDKGKNVLFLMDSVTRFAMAQREIGLAVGEPPATRGYTPSVFSVLPRLLERTGMGANGVGAITALYTVLVEGDDMNEPVADAVRGYLDGHIVLSRALATANHFPAIDVLESISRLDRIICNEEEHALVSEARDLLAIYRANEDLINVGAYAKNSNPRIDRAISKHGALIDFLKQAHNSLSSRGDSFDILKGIFAT